MAVKLEQKLTALEDEVIALKSTYTIYGGLVKSYMNTYSWTNNTGQIASLKVRFRPDYLRGEGKTLVFGFYYSATKNNVVEPLDDGFISIQDDSGDVILNIAFLFSDYTVNLTLFTSVPGTFTRLQ